MIQYYNDSLQWLVSMPQSNSQISEGFHRIFIYPVIAGALSNPQSFKIQSYFGHLRIRLFITLPSIKQCKFGQATSSCYIQIPLTEHGGKIKRILLFRIYGHTETFYSLLIVALVGNIT